MKNDMYLYPFLVDPSFPQLSSASLHLIHPIFSQKTTTLPTLLSQKSSLQLNNKVILLLRKDENIPQMIPKETPSPPPPSVASPFLPFFSLLNPGALPCDVHLVDLRLPEAPRAPSFSTQTFFETPDEENPKQKSQVLNLG